MSGLGKRVNTSKYMVGSEQAKFYWKVVNVILVNYERNTITEQDDEQGEAHHNWVDEVVSSEARGAIIEHDSSYMTVKPQAGTMCRILDPLFIYFDTNRKWVPPNGLGLIVVSDMAYFVESPCIYYSSLKFELCK